MGDRPAVVEQEAVKILLVDDDPKNLAALAVVLDAPDRELLQARSGQEAFKYLLDVGEVAVLVLDVHMPGMDGLETAALVRGRDQSRHTPIIFLTASGDAHLARGYALGAVDYISKPFDPHILRAKVAVFVELFRKSEEVSRLAAELAERARLEGALLAIRTAEHELGNQLGAASGQLQMLLRGTDLPPATRARVETALGRLQEAASTVHRLRNLTELPETDWGIKAGSTIDLQR